MIKYAADHVTGRVEDSRAELNLLGEQTQAELCLCVKNRFMHFLRRLHLEAPEQPSPCSHPAVTVSQQSL